MTLMRRSTTVLWTAVVLSLAVVSARGADPSCIRSDDKARFYQQHNLVSDGVVPADHIDPNLVNPWGVAFDPAGFAMVADNHSGVATQYDGAGVLQSPIVTIPPPNGATGPSAPTGVVFNATKSFEVSAGHPAKFLFATEDGTISAYAPDVDATNAILKVDNSAQNAIYKGIAIASTSNGDFIYATDFHNGKVDVFDCKFQPVTMAKFAFKDIFIPKDFAPFGIATIHDVLFVSFAKQNALKEDDVPGRGLGFIDVFDRSGRFLRRFATRGNLNAPWAMVVAPRKFGIFSERLLVGNFGDGTILAFFPTRFGFGVDFGHLRTPDGKILTIEGLWGLAFGNGQQGQPTNALFFAAGPNDENDGVYGRIDPVERKKTE